MTPRAQADGDPGGGDHAPLIEQIESWARQLDAATDLEYVTDTTAHARVIREMRQVAADLAREDDVSRARRTAYPEAT